MKRSFYLLVLLTITFSLFAQTAPDTLWTKSIGGEDYDDITEIHETSDGGFIITGYSSSFSSDYDDCWLVKMDANGFVEWEQVYGGSDSEKGLSVQNTSDGGYIIAGNTGSYGLGLYDMWLIKTDENGVMQWDQTYGSVNWEIAYSVQQTSDDGFILAGGIGYMYIPFHTDMLLVKTDEDGIEQWRNTYGMNTYNEAYSVEQTLDGGYIIAGETSVNGEYDLYLVKIDENGTLQWEQNFGGDNDDLARSVKQTSDGGFIVVGEASSYGPGDSDGLVIKTDQNGVIEWEQLFGGEYDDSFYSVMQTLDNGFIIAGHTTPSEDDSGDFWIIKINEYGCLQWDQSFGSSGWEWARSVKQVSDGGYVMAGFSQQDSMETRDGWIIRLGEEVSSNNYLIQNQDLTIYNYPNPFNPTTTIKFSIQNDSKVELSIYNIKGQKIKTVVNNTYPKGNHSVIWNGDDECGNAVSSGVYYYKLNVNGKIEAVKKCLLLK